MRDVTPASQHGGERLLEWGRVRKTYWRAYCFSRSLYTEIDRVKYHVTSFVYSTCRQRNMNYCTKPTLWDLWLTGCRQDAAANTLTRQLTVNEIQLLFPTGSGIRRRRRWAVFVNQLHVGRAARHTVATVTGKCLKVLEIFPVYKVEESHWKRIWSLKVLEFSLRGPWKSLNSKLVDSSPSVKNGANVREYSERAVIVILILIYDDVKGCVACGKVRWKFHHRSGKRLWRCLKVESLFLKQRPSWGQRAFGPFLFAM